MYGQITLTVLNGYVIQLESVLCLWISVFNGPEIQ